MCENMFNLLTKHAQCVYIHVQCMHLEEVGNRHCTVRESVNENGLQQPLDVMTSPADGCNPIANNKHVINT